MLKILTILLFLCPLTAIAFCGQPQLPKECDEHGNCRTTLPPSSSQKLKFKALTEKIAAEQKSNKEGEPNCLMVAAPVSGSKVLDQYLDKIGNDIFTYLKKAASMSKSFKNISSSSLSVIRIKVLANGNVENIDIGEYHGHSEFDNWLMKSLDIKKLKPSPTDKPHYFELNMRITASDLTTASKI